MKLKHKILLPILAVLLILSGVTLAVFASDPEATTATGGSLDVYKCNLSFRSNVCIKYAIATEDASVKMLIWRAPQSEYTYGSQAAILNPVGTDTIDEKNCLIFDYTELAAADMTEVVYARAFTDNGDGTYEYGAVKKYSILQYAYNKLGYTATASTDENLKQMLRDMLVYGASAQKYLERNTDRLATADFYQVVVEGGLLADGCTDGLYLPGESVTLIAPETNESGRSFLHWVNSAGETVGETATYALSVPVKHDTYTAVYNLYSQGLKFTSHGDGTCSVSGIGTCTDLDVKIPPVSPDGDAVTGIGNEAFKGCTTMKSIVIPEGVTTIGNSPFYECGSLESVSIPTSVTSFDVRVFPYCPALTSVTVAEGNAKYHSAGNCIIKTDTKTLIAGCKASVIPTDGSVTVIGADAFYACSGLTSLVIPEGVTSIGYEAFRRCYDLVSLSLSSTVKTIDRWAISDCTSLRTVAMSEGLEVIDQYAFDGCSALERIDIGANVTAIKDFAFNGCTSLASVTFAANGRLTSIGTFAFSNCKSLTGITIPASVTVIGWYAFAYCDSLSSITFENTAGWYYTSSSSSTSGTTMDVRVSTINATYLTDTYYYYYWKRV